MGRPDFSPLTMGFTGLIIKSSYSAVFGEFVGNESRQEVIALDRGAAQSFNRDWGVIITWKYDQPPYIESSDELLTDLTTAYVSGAKYLVVFDYPNVTGTDYGILTDADFQALQGFWNYAHANPSTFDSAMAQAAYVIPINYGFGFRGDTDTIWGLFPPDNFSAKIYADVQTLLTQYNGKLNIIFDNQTVIGPTLNKYATVLYWNQTIT